MLRHVAVVAAALSVLLCGTAADGGAWQSHDVYVDEHGRAWALQDLWCAVVAAAARACG